MRQIFGLEDPDIDAETLHAGTMLKVSEGTLALEVHLSKRAGQRLAERLAERHGWTVLEASEYWLDCVAALEEERSKWGRAEILLERACEELVGRGASTAAEECAAAAINATFRLVAEELHRIHREEVEARQEDR